uniref:Methyltransferase FkbM domain-containing protein n=1 Tax=viral metagenome TaxID=1070528 RepID=A0A6C0ARF7_9ZZZZ
MDIVNIKINKNCKLCIPSKDSNDNMYGSKNVQDSIRDTNIWSKEETSLFIDILNKNSNNLEPIIVDVGSNTGYFSMIALSYNFNVFAIEANPVYKKYLEKSIEINNFDKNRLKYFENFASNIKEDVIFDGWSGNKNMMSYNEKNMVKTIALDDICCDKEILILKIDVEGAEPCVFMSAKNLILNKKIKYIIFELTYIMKDKLQYDQINILPYLQSNDYELFEIVSNKLLYIKNIKQHMNYLIKEYMTNHLVHNPNLVNLGAGTNILAVYKGNHIPNVTLFN